MKNRVASGTEGPWSKSYKPRLRQAITNMAIGRTVFTNTTQCGGLSKVFPIPHTYTILPLNAMNFFQILARGLYSEVKITRTFTNHLYLPHLQGLHSKKTRIGTRKVYCNAFGERQCLPQGSNPQLPLHFGEQLFLVLFSY